ncbi:MAG: hypothetical protein C5B43_04485 [Verrucomicrobia bacterium]|nr:MAG: hypothetical protein C5B43_04485 [Verrucomicrobiota bacterium]
MTNIGKDYIFIKKETIYMTLTDIFKKLKQKENFTFGEPQNDQQIRDLENELKVVFPESYKEFLSKYGYASWFGGSIYGVSKNPYYDLLRKNKLMREEKVPLDFNPLPKDAFLIKDYGDAYFLLYGMNSTRAGQVGMFLSESGYQEEQSWGSFEEFLEDYYC